MQRLTPVIVAAVALTLFAPALISRDRVIGTLESNDLVKQFIPFQTYCRRAIGGGEWPLWTPNIMGGAPTAMFGQTGMFYPPTWLTLALPPADAVDAQLAMHFLIALFATFWGARRLGLSRGAAWVAAIAWALSGAMVGRLAEGHLTVYRALAWYPLAWCGILGLLRRRSWADGTATIIAIATMGLVGAPQAWLPALMALSATAVIATVVDARQRSARVAVPGLIRVGAVMLVAFLIAAAEWVPVIAVTPETARAQLPSEFSEGELAYPASQALTFAFPELFARQSNDQRATVGLAALLVALLGAGAFHDRRLAVTTAIAGALFFWLSLGPQWSLYSIAKVAFPPLRLIPGSWRFLFVVTWSLSLAAGMGVDGLRQVGMRCGRRVWIAAAALVVLAAVIAGVMALRMEERDDLTHAVAEVMRCLVFAGVLASALILVQAKRLDTTRAAAIVVALIALDLLSFQTRHFSTRPIAPDIALPASIERALPHGAGAGRVLNAVPEFTNLALIHNFEDINGYGVTSPADFARWSAWTTGGEPQAAHWTRIQNPSPSLRQWWAVNYLLTYASDPVDQLRWRQVVSEGGVTLWRAAEPIPTAEVRDFRQAVTRDKVESMGPMSSGAFQRMMLMIEGDAEDLSLNSIPSAPQTNVPRLRSYHVTPTTRTTNRRVWRIEAPTPTWLLIRETWSKGWRAKVNGERRRVYRAQGALCALPIPAGAYEVELRYRPLSAPLGATVSALTLLTLVALVLERRRKRAEGA